MATNDAKYSFGTQTEITVATPSSVGNGAMSVDADTDTWTNTNDLPLATFVLNFTPSATTVEGDTIDLYCRLIDIQSTSDEPTPSGKTDYKPHYLGSFIPDVDTAAQNLAIGPVALPAPTATAQDYEFYLWNNLNGAVSLDSGWSVWITPLTFVPSA